MIRGKERMCCTRENIGSSEWRLLGERVMISEEALRKYDRGEAGSVWTVFASSSDGHGNKTYQLAPVEGDAVHIRRMMVADARDVVPIP